MAKYPSQNVPYQQQDKDNVAILPERLSSYPGILVSQRALSTVEY